MLPYKNVYSLQDGRLVKNQDNKIEYVDENGKKRVKTNPTYEDFAKVGKYPLKEEISPSVLTEGKTPPSSDGGKEKIVGYEIKDGYIVPIYAPNETDIEEEEAEE